MKYIFLTDQFYSDYAAYTEIELKAERPYVQLYICVNDIDFAIPFRSNINHPHAFWTDKENRCGLDYSKSVVIEDVCYIDTERKPHIRENEHRALIGKEREVKNGLLKYINDYKQAKGSPHKRLKRLVEYSTLQYFEKYIDRL